MTDKEKVVKSLETCSDVYYGATGACSSCSFSQSKNCFAELVYQTIALLKEQEPMQMKISEDYGLIKFGECPKCKSFINNRYFPKSCGCGQAVQWNE